MACDAAEVSSATAYRWRNESLAGSRNSFGDAREDFEELLHDIGYYASNSWVFLSVFEEPFVEIGPGTHLLKDLLNARI